MLIRIVIFLLFSNACFSQTSIVGIGFRLNVGLVTGFVKSSSGEQITEGGVSLGYFTGNSPIWSDAPNAGNAWNWLRSNGYVDLRSIPDSILDPSPDYSFSSNPADSPYPLRPISAIDFFVAPPLSILVPSTQLYVVAFNQGNWDETTNRMDSASFGGTEWGVFSKINDINPSYNWYSPTIEGALKSLITNNLENGDVPLGSLSPNYSTDKTLLLAPAPEPSSPSLLALGGVVVALRKRKRV